jgi:hypothetical protein
MEASKFDGRREDYWRGIRELLSMGYPPEDLVHHFPLFAGHVCLGRYLALYEAYKLTAGLTGHIAEAGIWKGSSLLWFAKLSQLFEPESLTQTHGFDWFRGAQPEASEAHLVSPGAYAEDRQRVQATIDAQGLQRTVLLHEVDLSCDLTQFFATYPHLQFKLIFLDCGLYKVVRHCIEEFWPRLTPGGVLLFDNLNHETAPGETMAVRELLPEYKLHAFPFTQQPTAYIVKPGK